MHVLTRGRLAAASAALLPAGLLLTASPAAAQEEATVSVFHGVPGITVDVFANGDELIPDFTPGTLTDPLSLPAGTYDIQVFADGEGPSGEPAIEAADVEVPAGANATVAAHLDEAGDPTLTVFVNDTSALDAGKARVTVRHVAAAPAVDVRAAGQPVFQGLTNPNEDTAVVDAGTVSADVVLAGTDEPVLGPADLDLAEGTSTVVYAWGSADEGDLALKVQTISGLGSPPDGIPAGQGGLADADDGAPLWALALMAVATFGAAWSGLRLVRSRSHR